MCIRDSPQLNILIITGTPTSTNFQHSPGVDLLRLPGIKMISGSAIKAEFAALDLSISIDALVKLRSQIILTAVTEFRPQLVVVDKEPNGLCNELLPLFGHKRQIGFALTLGLRDVLDDPAKMRQEWGLQECFQTIEQSYDAVWVYGLSQINNPLEGVTENPLILDKVEFTGYLGRQPGSVPLDLPQGFAFAPGEYALVTAGGGVDGEALYDWVIRAYEQDRTLTVPAYIVFGPFLPQELVEQFASRAAKLAMVHCDTWTHHMEAAMHHAAGVIAMCGYNTFVEVLTYNKRAVMVPRTFPRKEQWIRASSCAKVGMMHMMLFEDGVGPERMAEIIRGIHELPLPHQALESHMLDGLSRVCDLVLGEGDS
eukprot:TRINITY_DN60460_c0_g1_i1.p1 TRINITY_DN60460_c0_g1~~TRINITY_DN60460_c0_g1_i1.p1  ORF type:complete len:369 (-),score=92.78 TRINITY_DN60460_c0_g1_i1:300-1406(-)